MAMRRGSGWTFGPDTSLEQDKQFAATRALEATADLDRQRLQQGFEAGLSGANPILAETRLQQAQTRKTGAEQKNLEEITRLLGPETMARIAKMNAEVRGLDANTENVRQGTQLFTGGSDAFFRQMGLDRIGFDPWQFMR